MNKKSIIVVFSIVAFFLLSLIPCHVLRIEAPGKHRTVFVQIIRPDYKFSTTYVHSVELCPVREYFTIDQDFRIVLYETTFSSCNTGLPTTLSGDEKLSIEDNQLRISNMSRVVEKLNLWVNTKYGNILTLEDGKTVKLPSLAGDALLLITVEKLPLVSLLYLKVRL